MTNPLVSCIMATYDRPAFLKLAVSRFMIQDYEPKELILVYDGEVPLPKFVTDCSKVHVVRLESKHNLSDKRNLGVLAATGEIMIHADDDDWYGEDRISRQVAPIITGDADLTGIPNEWLLYLPNPEFRRIKSAEYPITHPGWINDTNVAYAKKTWKHFGGFQSTWNYGEVQEFVREVRAHGRTLVAVPNEELFVYVRHQLNASQDLLCGQSDVVPKPEWFPVDVLSDYVAASKGG